jgi:hypothetical protein
MSYQKLIDEKYLAYFDKKGSVALSDPIIAEFKSDVLSYNENAPKEKEAKAVLSATAKEYFGDSEINERRLFEMSATVILSHFKEEQVYAILYAIVNGDEAYFLKAAKKGLISGILRRLGQYKQA